MINEKYKKLYELKKIELLTEKYKIKDDILQNKINAERIKVKKVREKLQ